MAGHMVVNSGGDTLYGYCILLRQHFESDEFYSEGGLEMAGSSVVTHRRDYTVFVEVSHNRDVLSQWDYTRIRREFFESVELYWGDILK